MIPRVARYKAIAVAGTLFSSICLAALAFLAGRSSLIVLELLTAGAGFGAGTTFPVATVSVQNAVDQVHLGVATGVLTFLRSLGGGLGVAVLGAIALGNGFQLGGESLQVASNHATSATPFAYIFLACTTAMALSLVLFLFMPEKPLRGRAESGME
jgi:MFS family permease